MMNYKEAIKDLRAQLDVLDKTSSKHEEERKTLRRKLKDLVFWHGDDNESRVCSFRAYYINPSRFGERIWRIMTDYGEDIESASLDGAINAFIRRAEEHGGTLVQANIERDDSKADCVLTFKMRRP